MAARRETMAWASWVEQASAVRREVAMPLWLFMTSVIKRSHSADSAEAGTMAAATSFSKRLVVLPMAETMMKSWVLSRSSEATMEQTFWMEAASLTEAPPNLKTFISRKQR